MEENTNEKTIDLKKKLDENKKKKIFYAAACASVLLIILLILFATGTHNKILNFFGIETNESLMANGISVSFTPTGDYVMSACKDTIIICDENGVTGYDENGVWKWNHGAKYVSPVITSYDDFALVYDSESKCAAVFNSSGFVWSRTFENTVRGAVAHRGTDFISVICDSEDYNTELIIVDYSEDSKDIFQGKFVDEYIITSAISPDRTQFALSGMYYEGDKTVGVIMFFRMSDGEIYSTEVFDGIYPYIEYSDSSTLIAANSDSLKALVKKPTIETKSDSVKDIWNRNSSADILLNIDVISDVGICAAFGNSDITSELSSVTFYGPNGNSEKKYEYKERICVIRSNEKEFAVCSGNAVRLFGSNFNMKGEYTSLSDAIQADFLNANKLLIQMESRIMLVEFTPE